MERTPVAMPCHALASAAACCTPCFGRATISSASVRPLVSRSASAVVFSAIQGHAQVIPNESDDANRAARLTVDFERAKLKQHCFCSRICVIIVHFLDSRRVSRLFKQLSSSSLDGANAMFAQQVLHRVGRTKAAVRFKLVPDATIYEYNRNSCSLFTYFRYNAAEATNSHPW
eukprot:SAG31_NODE_1682_length_7537_cov_4.810164_5_plen_173_part_00